MSEFGESETEAQRNEDNNVFSPAENTLDITLDINHQHSYLMSEDANLQLTATSYFSSLLSQDPNSTTQQVIDCGVIPRLALLLQKEDLTKDTRNNIFLILIKLGRSGDINAIIALTDTIKQATWSQVQYMITQGVLATISRLLHEEKDLEVKKLLIVLEGLENICRLAKEAKEFHIVMKELEAIDGLSSIEKLQCHDFMTVYEAALHLLETYFVVEDIVFDE